MGYDVYYSGEVQVSPALTEEDAAVVLAASRLEKTEATAAFFAAVASSPEPYLPHHAGLLEISEDLESILPEGECASRHGFRMWLRLLVEYYLAPRGYVLNGEVSWEGEEPEDRGILFVRDNQFEAEDDLILNPGPSWARNHFADDSLKLAIQELLDSADSTGCSPGLTVVSASSLAAIRSYLT